MTDVGVFADIYRRATADADISMSLKGNMLCHLQTNRCCISDKYWSLYVCVCVCVSCNETQVFANVVDIKLIQGVCERLGRTTAGLQWQLPLALCIIHCSRNRTGKNSFVCKW